MSPYFREKLATVLLCAVAVLVLAGQLGRWATEPAGSACGSGDLHVEQGEALIRGVPNQRVALAMPGASVPNALICGRLGQGGQLAARGLGLLATALLLFLIGWLLHSPLCGGLAALCFALYPAPPLSWDRWLYTLYVLLAAGAMVWRARVPSLRRSLALGLAIGMSLFVLSPLFLFPFVLLFEVWRQKGRGRWAQGAALCFVPFLFLVPWLLMNLRLGNGWTLFEAGRAGTNIITGALGFISTGQTAWNVLLPGLGDTARPLAWAASWVLSHPLDYLQACASRLVLALSYHPVLWAGAAAAFAFGRKLAGLRQLGWLALYFLAVHCLMPVEPRYFEPLVPVLLVMAVWAAVSRLPAPRSAGSMRPVGAALAAVGALLLAIELYAQGLVLAYPSRARSAPAAAWFRPPGQAAGPLTMARTFASRALAALDRGRAAEARQSLALMRDSLAALEVFTLEADRARLERLRPDWPRFETELLRETGRRDLLEKARQLLDEPPLAPAVRAGLWLAEARRAADSGRREGALAALDAAARLEMSAEQRLACARLLLRLRDEARVIAVLSHSKGPAAGEVDFLLETARAARARGQEVAALSALEACGRGRLSTAQALAAAGLYRDWGRPAEARALLRQAQAGHPRDADLLLELAAVEDRAGRMKRLEELSRLKLDGSQAARTARLCLDAAAAARDAGLRAEGLEALRLTAGLPLAPEQIRSAARLYGELGGPVPAAGTEADSEKRWREALAHQSLGEYRQALAILDRLVQDQPDRARWLGDRGVLRLLMGERGAGERDLRAAIARDPGFLSPYLSLGGLYQSQGRRQDALRLYDAALARAVPAGEFPARELQERIRSERDRLLAAPGKMRYNGQRP